MELKREHVAVIVDRAFQLVAEFFDLQQGNQWLRRRAFQVVRSLIMQDAVVNSVPQPIPDTNKTVDMARQHLTSMLQQFYDGCNEQVLNNALTAIMDSYWPVPDRQWNSAASPIPADGDYESELQRLLMDKLDAATDTTDLTRYAYRLIGRTQTEQSIMDFLHMLTNQDFVMDLLVSLLEQLISLLLQH